MFIILTSVFIFILIVAVSIGKRLKKQSDKQTAPVVASNEVTAADLEQVKKIIERKSKRHKEPLNLGSQRKRRKLFRSNPYLFYKYGNK